MMTIRIGEILAGNGIGAELRVEGWVRTRRDTGSFSFLELNDGSSLANLQIIADGDRGPRRVSRAHAEAVAQSVHAEGSRFRIDPIEADAAKPGPPSTPCMVARQGRNSASCQLPHASWP